MRHECIILVVVGFEWIRTFFRGGLGLSGSAACMTCHVSQPAKITAVLQAPCTVDQPTPRHRICTQFKKSSLRTGGLRNHHSSHQQHSILSTGNMQRLNSRVDFCIHPTCCGLLLHRSIDCWSILTATVSAPPLSIDPCILLPLSALQIFLSASFHMYNLHTTHQPSSGSALEFTSQAL